MLQWTDVPSQWGDSEQTWQPTSVNAEVGTSLLSVSVDIYPLSLSSSCSPEMGILSLESFLYGTTQSCSYLASPDTFLVDASIYSVYPFHEHFAEVPSFLCVIGSSSVDVLISYSQAVGILQAAIEPFSPSIHISTAMDVGQLNVLVELNGHSTSISYVIPVETQQVHLGLSSTDVFIPLQQIELATSYILAKIHSVQAVGTLIGLREVVFVSSLASMSEDFLSVFCDQVSFFSGRCVQNEEQSIPVFSYQEQSSVTQELELISIVELMEA